MTEKSSNLNSAFTIIEILKRIPRRKKITVSELLASLHEDGIDMPKRMLQRYLKALSEDPRSNLIVDKRGKEFGYERGLAKDGLTAINLLPQEALLLVLAKEFLKYQLPKSVNNSCDHLFEEAKEFLGSSPSPSSVKNWKDKIAFVNLSVPMVPPEIKPRIFDAVSEALYRNVKLEIEYEKLSGEIIKRSITPLGLVQQDVRVYLVCRFDGFNDVRHLALHRFKSAEETNFPGEYPPDFNLHSYLKEKQFNFGKGKIRLVLEYESPEFFRQIEETKLNIDQKNEKLEDGFFRLEAEVEDSVLLDGWIKSWESAGFRKVEKIPLEKPQNKKE